MCCHGMSLEQIAFLLKNPRSILVFLFSTPFFGKQYLISFLIRLIHCMI